MIERSQLIRELSALAPIELADALRRARSLRHSDPDFLFTDLVSAAHEVIVDWDLVEFDDIIVGVSEPTIEFQATQSHRNTSPRTPKAKFGGGPQIPEGFSWPRIEKDYLPFIAQLHLSELPRLPKHPLPMHGVLYFFCWCTNDRVDNPCEVRWLDAEVPPLFSPRVPKQRILPDWRGIRIYEEEVATESVCTLTVSKKRLERAALESNRLSPDANYSDFFGDFPSEYSGQIHHIVNPDFTEGVTWGRSLGYARSDFLFGLESVSGGYHDGKELWVNLLQIDSSSNVEWSDGGSLSFLIRAGDLMRRDFRHVEVRVLSS